MGKRTLQLVLIALAGALLVWWVRREPSSVAQSPPPPAARVAETPVLPAALLSPPPPSPPPQVRQPKVEPSPPPLPVAAEGKKEPDSFEVPRDWLLRGSNAKGYELRTDRSVALGGHASAVLYSHEKDIPPNLTGSAVQAISAAPYLGLRVELTAATRGQGVFTAGETWMYVTDAGGTILAYQSHGFLSEPTGRNSSGEWQHEWKRRRIVMDVPSHAESVVYGFSLRGVGKLWADEITFTAVDKSIALTSSSTADPVRALAQAVGAEGALAKPSNLDFEYFIATRERQAPAPRDAINRKRF